MTAKTSVSSSAWCGSRTTDVPRVSLRRASDGPAPTIVVLGDDAFEMPPTRSEIVAFLEPVRRGAMFARPDVAGLGVKSVVVFRTGPASVVVEFVQGLPGGAVDPSSTLCLNSMSCAVAALEDWGGPLPDTLSVRMGSVVYRLDRAVPPRPGLASSRLLVAELTRNAVAWHQSGRRAELPATMMAAPTRYLLVATPTASAHLAERALEGLRQRAVRDVGWSWTENQPKIGCVWPTGDEDVPLEFRTRQNPTGGWHPKIASSGLLVLAMAAATPGTVVHDLLDGATPSSLAVRTPIGVRTMTIDLMAAIVAIPCSSVEWLGEMAPAELLEWAGR